MTQGKNGEIRRLHRVLLEKYTAVFRQGACQSGKQPVPEGRQLAALASVRPFLSVTIYAQRDELGNPGSPSPL